MDTPLRGLNGEKKNITTSAKFIGRTADRHDAIYVVTGQKDMLVHCAVMKVPGNGKKIPDRMVSTRSVSHQLSSDRVELRFPADQAIMGRKIGYNYIVTLLAQK